MKVLQSRPRHVLEVSVTQHQTYRQTVTYMSVASYVYMAVASYVYKAVASYVYKAVPSLWLYC